MNKKAKNVRRLLSATLAGSLLLGGSLQAQATTLRLAHTFNPGEASYEVLQELGKTVEERSGGDLKIQVYPSEQLGTEVQLLQQAKNGSVDIVVPGYSGASTLVPALEISNAPFMVPKLGRGPACH